MIKKETIFITSDYLTLGQLIKFTGLVASGCEVKQFLAEHTIFVNQVLENRRGKKLYLGDQIEIKDLVIYLIDKES